MSRRLAANFALCIVAVFAFAACGGGGDGGDDGSSRSDDRDEQSADAVDETTASKDDDATEKDVPDSADTDSSDAGAADPAAPTVDILTDFGDVCRSVSLPGATAYDPARTGTHPLITMSGEGADYQTSLALLPDQWDPVIGEEQTVELVACLARTSTTLIETCTGYLDDDNQDIGNTVELYDASYDVQLIAATTGEVIATTQLDATEDTCPSFVFFDADESVKPWYAEPTDELTAFLAPFVET